MGTLSATTLLKERHMAERKKLEYRIVETNGKKDFRSGQMQIMLDKMGNEGWSMVAQHLIHTDYVYFIFVREKE